MPEDVRFGPDDGFRVGFRFLPGGDEARDFLQHLSIVATMVVEKEGACHDFPLEMKKCTELDQVSPLVDDPDE